MAGAHLTADSAISYIVSYARKPETYDYGTYGYEIYLPIVIVSYLKNVLGRTDHTQGLFDGSEALSLWPVFSDAAWYLCRRGILRPSVRERRGQSADPGAGFSLTEVGRAWVMQPEQPVEMIEPGRLVQQFAKLSQNLGKGFLQRAREAANCHMFDAHLACCAMCGAAAESIILSVAAARLGDSAAVLKKYRSASGRNQIINAIVGQSAAHLSRPFESAMQLLAYWRDDAAHGLASTISEIEAHDALARLLRFSQFVNDNWAELTKVPPA